MTYRIGGLERTKFTRHFEKIPQELLKIGALRVTADADRGYPCRTGLDDARAGESLILLNYVRRDGANPYRRACAIGIRQISGKAVATMDRIPPALRSRVLSLRRFDAHGMRVNSRLAPPGAAYDVISATSLDARVACIHAHNAAYGCIAAKIARHGRQRQGQVQ